MKKFKYLFLLLLTSCLENDQFPDDQKVWGYEKPSVSGFNEEDLLLLDGQIKDGDYENVYSLIVISDDNIVYENYYDGAFRSELRSIGIATQIVTVAALGLIMEEGYIQSLDDPISEYLPSYFNVFDAQPEKKDITIRHLLDNKSGFVWDRGVSSIDPQNDLNKMKGTSDWSGYVIKQDMEAPPGIRLILNPGTGAILSSIMEYALGDTDLEQYIVSRIFEPLGISDYEWVRDFEGNLDGASGLKLKDLDFAKLGYLFLDYGLWNRQRIISEDWAFEMLSIKHEISIFYSNGYAWGTFKKNIASFLGYSEGEVFFTPVEHGQILYIIPRERLVVVVYAENYFYGLGSPTNDLFFRLLQEPSS